MSPIVFNIQNAVLREKMASFYYDWTMVCPKNGKKFPSNVNDWQWLYPCVSEKIKNIMKKDL